jgi:BolA protein
MTAQSQATKAAIEHKIKTDLDAIHVEVEDESWKHAGHAGAAAGGGHFTLVVVSPKFEGLNPLDRRRLVFSVLQSEMQGEIHALTVRALSPSEWAP